MSWGDLVTFFMSNKSFVIDYSFHVICQTRIKRGSYRTTVLFDLCYCLRSAVGERQGTETCRKVSPDREGECLGAARTMGKNAQESSSSQRSTGMHKKQNKFVCFQMAAVKAGTREVQGSALLGHRNRWLFTARMLLLSLLFSFNSLVRA